MLFKWVLFCLCSERGRSLVENTAHDHVNWVVTECGWEKGIALAKLWNKHDLE